MLSLAIAPIIILLLYIYIRDFYEKEPFKLLLVSVIMGAIISPTIIFLEEGLMSLNIFIGNPLYESLFISFVVAAFIEEGMKFVVLYFLAFHNREYNEPFDGIVYASFIALGFAMVENILYTFGSYGSIATGIARSITAVPAHAMYGIVMGYYLSKYKFTSQKRYFVYALLYPILYHGLYDFTLIYPYFVGTFTFAIVLIGMIILSYLMLKELSKSSPFRAKGIFIRYKSKIKSNQKLNEEMRLEKLISIKETKKLKKLKKIKELKASTSLLTLIFSFLILTFICTGCTYDINTTYKTGVELINMAKEEEGNKYRRLYAMDNNTIEDQYEIDLKYCNDYTVFTSLTGLTADEIAIFKVDEEYKDEIKKAFEVRKNKLKEYWKDKNNEEYSNIKKALICEIGDYEIMMIKNNIDEDNKRIIEELNNKLT